MSKQEFDSSQNDFIMINQGMEYIRKFEIVGLRWKAYYSSEYLEDPTLKPEKPQYRLEIFLNDCPSCVVINPEEARSVMRAFDLPEDPPQW